MSKRGPDTIENVETSIISDTSRPVEMWTRKVSYSVTIHYIYCSKISPVYSFLTVHVTSGIILCVEGLLLSISGTSKSPNDVVILQILRSPVPHTVPWNRFDFLVYNVERRGGYFSFRVSTWVPG